MKSSRPIYFKPGVKTSIQRGGDTVCIQPETVIAITLATNVYYDAREELQSISDAYNDMPSFVVTSICDGNHKKGSKHYDGYAFDFRTWLDNSATQLARLDKGFIRKQLKAVLGDDYDVVIEKTHIHVELDP